MKIVPKSILAAGAAAVALAGMAAPLQARDRYNDDHIDAGDVIAGALIIGGLAAILSSGSNRNDGYYDNYHDGYRGNRGGYGYDYRRYGGRQAVDQCVRSVEYQASRYGRADVTQITDIDRKSYGYKIEGRIVVQDRYRDNDRYDRYGRYDRGYGRNTDEGRFNCYVEQGRVTNIEFRGLDGWR
jgi:hypothetical protein